MTAEEQEKFMASLLVKLNALQRRVSDKPNKIWVFTTKELDALRVIIKAVKDNI